MPLKLIPPRQGRSKNYRIRGTYLKCYVDESAGTADKKIAQKKLDQIRSGIERGEFSKRGEPVFLDAVRDYLEAGGDGRFLGRFDPDTGKWTGLTARLQNLPLTEITQATIDAIALELHPNTSPATRNRQVYTPVSAVLKRAGIERSLRRPPGSQGTQRTDWLWPERAFAIFAAARQIDPEFEIFLFVLCYTGMRLSDALKLGCDYTRVAEAYAYLGTTKTGKPRGVFLPPVVVAKLANHPRGLDRPGEKVFRFNKNGRLYNLMADTLKLAGITLPPGVKFHIWCHTWATWMRRYGGADKKALIATGRWDDEKSVARYEHAVASEEAGRAAMLPTPPAPTKKRAAAKRRIRAKSVELKTTR